MAEVLKPRHFGLTEGDFHEPELGYEYTKDTIFYFFVSIAANYPVSSGRQKDILDIMQAFDEFSDTQVFKYIGIQGEDDNYTIAGYVPDNSLTIN